MKLNNLAIKGTYRLSNDDSVVAFHYGTYCRSLQMVSFADHLKMGMGGLMSHNLHKKYQPLESPPLVWTSNFQGLIQDL